MHTRKKRNPSGLWTKDFTIITVGSVISMFGNALAGFAISLLILDYTQSTMLYGIFIVLYTAPQILMPAVSGPILDRFSRKKMIYTLDFISSALYGTAAFVLYHDWFSYPMLAVGAFLVGSIDSVYRVAYDSFYPLLIQKENYQKAYSIASVLDTLSMVMVPVSAFLYNLMGIWPLFTINAVSFFCAAVMETRIRQDEHYLVIQKENQTETGHRQWSRDLKEGMQYLKNEKGLLAVALYFACSALLEGAVSVISLPYFKMNYKHGEYVFMIVGGLMFLGRMCGGLVHYQKEFPPEKKYRTALFVYTFTSLIMAFLLYLPLPAEAVLSFISGILGVTSYTIRISATQQYVPDEKKGRFNAAFQLLSTAGMLAGEGLSSVLSGIIDERLILMVFGLFTVVMAVVLIGSHPKEIAKIYNV